MAGQWLFRAPPVLRGNARPTERSKSPEVRSKNPSEGGAEAGFPPNREMDTLVDPTHLALYSLGNRNASHHKLVLADFESGSASCPHPGNHGQHPNPKRPRGSRGPSPRGRFGLVWRVRH